MQVKIKLTHPNAKVPAYSKPGDAGMDLTAVSVEYDESTGNIIYKTGVSIEIPEGYAGLLYPRSSLCKKELTLTNSVGVIDSTFRGDISAVFKPTFDFWQAKVDDVYFQLELEKGKFYYYETASDEYRKVSLAGEVYAIGDRIGQIIIMPYPKIDFEIVDELRSTERGEGGYGSTGR